MLRFCFLAGLCVSSFLPLPLPAAARNVVWIIADDMSPDIAALGASGVKTPNLDRLVREGRSYSRAYSSAPVCSASRSAFILGTYQTKTGLHAHDVENPQPLPPPYKPLPTSLREAGWFVTNAPAPDTVRSGKKITKGKTHYNFAHDPKVMFNGDDWRKRKPEQRFFAQFQISEPHRPFPIPESFPADELAAIKLPPNYPDHPLMRRDWYAYQRSVEMVDHRVGVILDQLSQEGVLEDTLVIFFADHGRPMPWGKQWLSVEGLHVPLLMRGPGIDAHSAEDGLVSLVDLAPTVLALAGLPIPDWMDGKNLLGSIFPQRDHVFAARDRCGDAQDRIRAVITKNDWLVQNFHPETSRLNWSSYKEEQYPGMPLLRALQRSGGLDELQSLWMQPTRATIEFYDLKADPLGMKNLAVSAQPPAEISSLRATLDDWVKTSGDRGALPDPPTEPSLAEIQKAKRAGYEKVWQKRMGKPEPTDEERVAWWMQSYHIPAATALP